MKKSIFISAVLLIATIVCGLMIFRNSNEQAPAAVQTPNRITGEPAQTADAAQILRKQKIAEEYGKLPINFEPNVGQTDERVKFMARGHGYSLFLTDAEAVLALRKQGKTRAQDKNAVVKIATYNGNPAADSTGAKIARLVRFRFRKICFASMP